MNSPGRIFSFITIVLTVWTLMHLYVLGRVLSVPAITNLISRRWIITLGVLLWVSFPLAHSIARQHPTFAGPLEMVGSAWVGVIFLLLVWLLSADILTGFGYLFPKAVDSARMAAIGIAGLLSLVSLIQATRFPAIRSYDMRVKNLRPEYEGLKIVQLSDMHLGSLLGERWLQGRVREVLELKPDLLFLTGDIVEEVSAISSLLPRLKELKARYGVWAVSGNHEFYAGIDRSMKLFETAGFNVLRDQWKVAAPGLVIAGVDDLTARHQFNMVDNAVGKALSDRPAGTTIFLSHTPWEVEKAAQLGADLMLSGHTHDGQIWPFGYLVRLRYKYLSGLYNVGGMPLIVSRGTGFWGPPMRLWHRSEIVKITLKAQDITSDMPPKP